MCLLELAQDSTTAFVPILVGWDRCLAAFPNQVMTDAPLGPDGQRLYISVAGIDVECQDYSVDVVLVVLDLAILQSG